MTSFGWIFNLAFPGSFRASETGRSLFEIVEGWLMALSLLCVFGIFNFTESNPGKEWTGFPYRLFTLPVSTLRLVTLPVALGVLGVGGVFAVWTNLVFTHGEIGERRWFAFVLAVFMMVYQAVLWSLAGFRIGRIVVLGLTGPLFVLIACLPFTKGTSLIWFSEKFWTGVLAGMALAAFGGAWLFVSRQRCGGGRRRHWFKLLVERIADALPRRKGIFRSPAAAQFWYEWRRSGVLLPACIGLLLALFIGPLSWYLRHEAAGTIWILAWTLALPLVLALPLGKGFSKADFWSKDLSLPAFVAVRPLATGEMVVIKMKVAALSAIISWLLVAAFLSLWLPLWANLEPLTMLRIGFWMAYGHSLAPQYVIAALFFIASMLLTWKFLVSGLWIGLSGNRKLYVASAAAYCGVPLLVLVGVTLCVNRDEAVRAWIRDDPNRLLSCFLWIAVFGVVAKFWIAAASWRAIGSGRTRRYVLLWCGATLALIALGTLMWAHGLLDLTLVGLMDFLPLDVVRLQSLMILVALLVIPFARLGLAPPALTKNRHG